MANLWCEVCGQRVSESKITLSRDFCVFAGQVLVRAYRNCLRCGRLARYVRDAQRDKAHAAQVRETVTFIADSPVNGGFQDE